MPDMDVTEYFATSGVKVNLLRRKWGVAFSYNGNDHQGGVYGRETSPPSPTKPRR